MISEDWRDWRVSRWFGLFDGCKRTDPGPACTTEAGPERRENWRLLYPNRRPGSSAAETANRRSSPLIRSARMSADERSAPRQLLSRGSSRAQAHSLVLAGPAGALPRNPHPKGRLKPGQHTGWRIAKVRTGPAFGGYSGHQITPITTSLPCLAMQPHAEQRLGPTNSQIKG
jgi:hypothetical protein